MSERNFRLFIAGQFVSFTGTWVQRVGQDWLVLSLTNSVTAVGITSGLQALPVTMLAPIGGILADRYPKRRVLVVAQLVAAVIAASLAILSFTGLVRAWHVYLAALLLGIESSVENPVRYTLISDLIEPGLLRNAISIQSSAIQMGALIGPAISGLLLSSLGFGPAFATNAVSYAVSITALTRLRHCEPEHARQSREHQARLRGGLRYVTARRDILWPIVLIGFIGIFTMNLSTTLAGFSRSVLNSGAGGYGLLNSVLATGSLTGALISARLRRNGIRIVLGSAATMAGMFVLASIMPSRGAYCAALILLGGSMMLYLTSTNVVVQLAADGAVRGRVMGVYTVVYFGGGALGGPFVGWLDTQLGPRLGMSVTGLIAGAATAAVAIAARTPARRRNPATH